MRHIFAPLYWLLFIAIVGLLALTLWTIGSDAGSRWLVKRLVAVRPGVVTVEGMHGNLARGPSLDRIAIVTARQEIELRGVAIDYQLAPLQKRRLRIRRLEIDALRWRLPDSGENGRKEKIELPVLRLPLDILVDRLHIGSLVIERAGKKPIEVRNVELRAGLQRNRLLLSRLRFDAGDYHAGIGGSIDFKQPPHAALTALIEDDDNNRLDLTVTGRLQDYRLSGNADTVRHQKIPPARTIFSGRGDLDGIDIESLQMETAGGSIVANGKLRWRDGFAADTSFSGSRIDPGIIDERYSGRIGFGGQARFTRGRLSGQIAMLGEINNLAFRIESDAEFEKGRLSVRQGRLVMGPNRLAFAGTVDRERAHDLTVSLDLPRLDALYPPLRGAAKGSGHIDGEWRQPQGKLELSTSALGWRDFSLAALTLQLESARQAGTADYAIEARGLSQKRLELAEVTLHGRLSETHQQGRLRLRDPARELEAGFDFSGNFDRQEKRWLGTIDNGLLAAPGLARFRQQKASAISLATGRLQLEKTCFAGAGNERLCLGAELLRDEPSNAVVSLSRFPLKRLSRWYPLTRYLRDTVDARIEMAGTPEKINATASLVLDDDNRFDATLAFAPATQELGGKISGRFDRLRWLEPLSEGIMNPRGRVELALTLGGTLPEPELHGSVALKDGSVRLPAAGTKINKINVTATTSDGRSADIDGSLSSGDGKITLKGQALWPTLRQWRADILLRGEHFLAASLPVARVWISPQLQIAATAKRVDVVGELKIPEAEIRIREIPESAVTPSEDVYFLDAAGEQEKPQRIEVYSHILLQLGDSVHLSGYGLNTDLGGKLLITEAPGQAVSADGSLRVVNGFYEALGQKLEIERGEIYWNGPLDEPALNLRAVRKEDGVTTGLEIRGPILHPESRIFSDPPMDETNALAYLLTGKPLGATSAADSNMLLTAVARLGLKGSARLVDDLRRRAGLDTLAIQPGEDIEQSTLVIGKYLSARFYVEYTTSLFEDSSVLSIRYRLNRHLQLEAESSDKRQSIDLIYEIEH